MPLTIPDWAVPPGDRIVVHIDTSTAKFERVPSLELLDHLRSVIDEAERDGWTMSGYRHRYGTGKGASTDIISLEISKVEISKAFYGEMRVIHLAAALPFQTEKDDSHRIDGHDALAEVIDDAVRETRAHQVLDAGTSA